MLRSYVKGAASYVLPQARNSHRDVFPVSAEHFYSQFLRHFIIRSKFHVPCYGESVVELGPGSALGFGLAALIAGASSYQTFDVAVHFDVSTNLRIFDELVPLFQKRTPVPHEGEFVRVFPFLDGHSFPAVLSDWMADALSPERLARIRRDIETEAGEIIRINVGEAGGTIDRPADWLFSHAVLEHVDDLQGIYAFQERALSSRGVMTHLIDFCSHNLTKVWNGHWALGNFKWKILRGHRIFLINREPLATHLALLERYGMRVEESRLHRRVDGLLKASFSPDFANMSSIDASTHMAFLVCSRSLSVCSAQSPLGIPYPTQ
jgi:hypothetical protein